MCWLVHKPSGKEIPEAYIVQAEKHNKDGYGIAYAKNNTIIIHKTLDPKEFRIELAKHKDEEIVVHLRAASVGEVSEAAIHPFDVPNGVMFHNGTFSTLRTHKGVCETTGCDESDTMAFANLLQACKYNTISDVLPLVQHLATDYANRLLFLETDGKITFVNKSLGNEEDGIWYSNTYHIAPKATTYAPGKTHVFVYGTLKSGYNNNARLLSTSRLVGDAVTAMEYFMVGKGDAFPYLLGARYEFPQKTGAKQIIGEVYEVDSHVLADLDRLEGVPSHYYKRQLMVQVKGESRKRLVTAYIKTNVFESDFEDEMIAEWTGVKSNYTQSTATNGVIVHTQGSLQDKSFNELFKIFTELHQELYESEPSAYHMPITESGLIEEIIGMSDELVEDYLKGME